jgi:organic hydroperoxide reductase OsmC/OhrA
MTEHRYSSRIAWTGNRGGGTTGYRSYDRTWDIITPGKPIISCSNDPLLGGDPALPNPEDLLLSALAACHMLWYLHYASADGIVVTAYQDTPIGIGETAPSGAGRFLKAMLKPHITLAAGSDLAAADAIHGRIHAVCFLARSVNCPISCEAAYATA